MVRSWALLLRLRSATGGLSQPSPLAWCSFSTRRLRSFSCCPSRCLHLLVAPPSCSCLFDLLSSLQYEQGYALFAYCLTLLFEQAIEGDADFYLAWFSLGLLSSLSLTLTLHSKTPDSKQGWIVGGVVGGLHWLYLLFLHRRYAHVHIETTPSSA
eukprot:m.320877 g.320877  ORF g.320877 m.320877 type:complete len:155 (-) comp55511_c0_seq9:116-580(-)